MLQRAACQLSAVTVKAARFFLPCQECLTASGQVSTTEAVTSVDTTNGADIVLTFPDPALSIGFVKCVLHVRGTGSVTLSGVQPDDVVLEPGESACILAHGKECCGIGDLPGWYVLSGPVSGITTVSPLMGDGSGGDPLTLIPGGSVGNVLQWNGAEWVLAHNVATNAFVFRPGGIAAGNVFTDWASLIAAHALVEGPRTIELDDRFGAIVIPAGGPYDMRDTKIRGRLLAGIPVVATITPGATFTNLEWLEWTRFDYTHTASAMVVPAGLSYFRMWGGSIQNGGSGAFFDITTPGAVLLTQFDNAGGFNPFPGTPVAELGSVGTLSFSLDEASSNGTDTVSGTPGSSVLVTLRDPSARLVPVAGPFTGTVVPPIFVSIAANITYTDGTAPPAWSAPAPTNVQDAIDRLAVAVNGLLGGGGIP